MELKIMVSDDFVIPSSCAECEFIKVDKNEYANWDDEVFKCIFTNRKYDIYNLPHKDKDKHCPFQ